MASTVSSLPSKNWSFLGEGGRHVVFRCESLGSTSDSQTDNNNNNPGVVVVRVRKKRMRNDDAERCEDGGRKHYVKRLRDDFEPNMVVESNMICVDKLFLEMLQKVLNEAKDRRESKRLGETLNTEAKRVERVSDCTRLPGKKKKTTTWSVEIKPKCGVLPRSPFISRSLKRRRSRFYMHQRYKLKHKKIASCSLYEPLDLFDSLRRGHRDEQIAQMTDVLQNLAKTPQNNFRVFCRGVRVYDTDTSHSFLRVVSTALVQSRALRYLCDAQERLNPYDIEMVQVMYRRCVDEILLHHRMDVRASMSSSSSEKNEKSRTKTELLFLDKLFDISVPLSNLSLGRSMLDNIIMNVSNRTRTYSASLTLGQAIVVIRQYLYWKMLCDISLFVTFEPLDDVKGDDDEDQANRCTTLDGSSYRYRVRIVDTDLKSHRKIPKYWHMDEAIVRHYESNLLEESLPLLSAYEVVEKLRSGKVAPSKLLDIVRTRMVKTESIVHATPTLCLDRAEERVRKMMEEKMTCDDYGDDDTSSKTNAASSFCLYGLPVLIKDLNDVKGVRTTRGSVLYAHHVANRSGPMVRVLESRGAVVVGKTNTPEFGAGSQTFNRLFPTTVSPWDIRTTSGGSSGGAAAALASCQCWLATGSDLGGSLRTPAAFCGVVGLRASPGRVPRDDVFSASGPRHNLQSVNGPMGRCVRDVGLFLDTMSSMTAIDRGWDFPEPKRVAAPELLTGALKTMSSCWVDSWESAAVRGTRQGVKAVSSMMLKKCSRSSSSSSSLSSSSSSSMSVGFSLLGCTCDPSVVRLARKATESFVRALNAMDEEGDAANIQFIDTPFDHKKAWRIFRTLRAEKFASAFKSLIAKADTRATLKPEVVWNTEQGLDRGDFEFKKARDRALHDSKDLLQHVEETLFKKEDGSSSSSKRGRIDILFTPATMCAAFDAEYRYPSELQGVSFSDYLDWMRIACVVSSTQCPAIVLPCGRLPCGRPVGVQIVAAPGADATVLAAAAFLETVLSWECPTVRGLHATCPDPKSGFGKLIPGVRGPRTVKEARVHHRVV